ncbi:ArnT family glycosyltransferase [Salidesulfovibrio onnuriiensis]|uniref:ArnT family glycosyltransferase n=1 Tax=Salidesulfovibrio onnuriiensis TaxID=2583823 RepID=UPI0011C92C2E|nr:glycosyltransferase family 39 protein [Salidesulfovibrio onnuriiensis]
MNTLGTRIWDICKNHPWLFTALTVAAQTWFTLNNRALWFSDEVRYADAYQNLAQHGHWMVLSLNGLPYPDKPPVYFWFLWLLDTLTPADMPTVFFLGAALSGLLFLYASYALARTLGFNRDISLGAVLILLTNFFLVGLFHYSRMDLLFSAAIVGACACFFRALTNERQGPWPVAGFALAGLATLIKGPLGFIIPVMTLLLWSLWRGQPRRLFTLRFLAGLGVMLGMLTLWVLGVMLDQGPSFLLDTVIGKHVVQRATNTFHHRESLQYYFIALPLAWLPWTLFPVALPWKGLATARFWKGILRERRQENGRRSFLWCLFLGTFVLLSSLSGKVLIYILPMFPALALLMAEPLLNLLERRSRRLWVILASFCALMGAGLFLGADLAPLQTPVRGLALASLVLLAAGTLLYLKRNAGPKANMLLLCLTVTAWLYPVGLLVAPSLDPAMSPRPQAELLKTFADKGYAPMSFKTYPGIFTYYAGHQLFETGRWPELDQFLKEHDKVVLVIRKHHWEEWKDRPEDLMIINSQEISGSTYLLVVKENPAAH